MKNPATYVFLIVGVLIGYFVGINKRDEELISQIQEFGDFSQTSAAAFLAIFKDDQITRYDVRDFLNGMTKMMESLERNVMIENVKAGRLAWDTLSLLDEQKNEELIDRQYTDLVDFYQKHHDYELYKEPIKSMIREIVVNLESDPGFLEKIDNANQAAHTTPASAPR